MTTQVRRGDITELLSTVSYHYSNLEVEARVEVHALLKVVTQPR